MNITDCRRTPHFLCVCFREARQLVCGWLKHRIDGEKYTYIYMYTYYRWHLACTCILFLSPRPLLCPSSADTCSHAHILRNPFFSFLFISLSLSLPPLVLSIHISPLRGGGAQPWGGSGSPSSTPHHHNLGRPPSLPLSLSSLRPTHPLTHQVFTIISALLLLRRSQSFVRLGFMCVRGQFYRWLFVQWLFCAPK